MNFLLLDVVLYVLLFVSAGFGVISVIGIWLFPDIRSRQFTGVRAALISFGSISFAVILYCLNATSVHGGFQYLMLGILTIVLAGLVVVGNHFAAKIINQQSVAMAGIPRNALNSNECDPGKDQK